MSNETRTVTLAVRCMVTMTVDAQEGPEGVRVVVVRRVAPPAAHEVMEALDAGQQFGELDDAFEAAGR